MAVVASSNRGLTANASCSVGGRVLSYTLEQVRMGSRSANISKYEIVQTSFLNGFDQVQVYLAENDCNKKNNKYSNKILRVNEQKQQRNLLIFQEYTLSIFQRDLCLTTEGTHRDYTEQLTVIHKIFPKGSFAADT
ncbi:hypothetical protein Y1Q_0015191 [Alligator mississippiensis]|uniref:Uncharacterized protein n=1 Tax=Alligator mississippiensis TaxID=8496 RepID=A0A151P8Y3_ALLMI|nr:hypothetical protein Y1Q_0015191 [Alligator mississippiensis]